MDNKRACPLSFNVPPNLSNDRTYVCMEEKCAWWNTECQKCALVVMVDNLRKLVKK
jgi:hypothetical protein